MIIDTLRHKFPAMSPNSAKGRLTFARWIMQVVVVGAVLLAFPEARAQAPGRYVAVDFTTARAHVLDGATNTEIAVVSTGASPSSVVISPNHRLAFVANLNSDYVSVLDLTIGAEIKRIRNVRLVQLAMSADGQTVVGTDIEDDGITVIDVETLTVRNHISVNGRLGDSPTLNPDLILGSLVIVDNSVYLNSFSDVGMVNLLTGAVTDIASTPASFPASFFQKSTAATPDGKFVLAARQGALLVIDVSTNTVAATVPISGQIALSVSATRDGSDPTRIFGYVLRDTGFDRRFDILDLNSGSATFGGTVGELVLPGLPADFSAQIAPNANGTRAYLTVGVSAKPNVFVVDTSIAVTPVLVSQTSIGIQLSGIAADIIQGPPTSSLTPVVTATTPLVTNDLARTIQISGSGYAPDAQVRVGTLDPVASQFISSSLLQVTIPQSSPAQQASIIVTNPNHGQSATFQNLSAILPKALIIASPPAFRPGNQVGVANFGDSTFSVLNTGTNETPAPSVFAGARALGFAITPDGSRAYIESLSSPGTVSVFNFVTRLIESTIRLDPTCTAPGQTRGVALGPRFGTGQITAYVVCSRRAAGQRIQDLYMIDAEPSSPTFNAVINRTPTGAPPNTSFTGPLAITPDGHFAFIGNFGSLIVLDTSNGLSTAISNATLGISPAFQPTLEVSPDGRFLVANSADFSSLLVFDITTPATPALVATVRGTTPLPGFPRIVGSRLYSFDNTVNTVDVFNFNPALNDFAELATFVVPGTLSEFGAVFDVTPDGKLLYLPMREEDSVAVLDVDKIVAHDPTALLTKIAVGIAPSMAAVRPVTAALGTISVSTNNAAATFTISDGVGHTFTGGGTTFTQSAPAGTYTIAFGSVAGFATPDSQTQSLLAGGSISFVGTYSPLPPENLHATVGNAMVTLFWSPSPAQPDGYRIYADRLDNNVPIPLGVVNPTFLITTTTARVFGLANGTLLDNGTLYRFHVTAVKAGVESLPSNFVLARPGQFAVGQPLSPPGKYPILFLHGIISNSLTWDNTKAFLTGTLGWKFGGTLSYSATEDPASPQHPPALLIVNDPANIVAPPASADFFTVDFGSPTADYTAGQLGIRHQADEVAGFIRTLRLFGRNKVNLVAHSMGGLAARAYVAENADSIQSVNELVTYGTPHWGVPAADENSGLGQLVTTFLTHTSGTQGLKDMTVDCVAGKLDFSGNDFLNWLRDQTLPDQVSYFVVRGRVFRFTDTCLSADMDLPVRLDSADLEVPAGAPVGQITIARKLHVLTTDKKHTDETSDFAAILCALDANCSIYQGHSPIDIEIIAPDGRAITHELTEIPGASYMEVPEDRGGTSATVLLPFPLEGTYSVKVVPKPGAVPTDTYSLDVTRAGVTTVLAQNQSIQAIPAQPYVVPVLAPLAIDIKPGSDPNSIKLGSGGKIPVAILSTADFNAPARVDASTLSFGHFGDEQSLGFCNTSGEDVNGDGLPDLVCHFFTQQTGFVVNDAVGVLKGKTKDGVPFVGTDSVSIIPRDASDR